MKRKTLLVIIAIVIVIGATAGGVYYYNSLDSATSQEGEPTSTPPQEEEPTSPPEEPEATVPEEEPEPTPPQEEEPDTTDSASAPWTITKISNVSTAEYVTEPPGPFMTNYLPPTEAHIFLLVSFELEATAEAEELSVQEILVIVDAIHKFTPRGWVVSSGGTNIGTFFGDITQEGADLSIVVKDGDITSRADFEHIDLTDPFTFVYVLPRTYLDATHNLQLQISGFGEGVEFTVEPPPATP